MLIISLVYWSLWPGSFLGVYDVMNSCMFTCGMSHLIGLQVGCSGAVVETFLSYGVWRIRRSQWPRGLRHELSSLARMLRSWARIPLKAWCVHLFRVCVVLCVGRGLVSG
jgi:hypothetical protein